MAMKNYTSFFSDCKTVADIKKEYHRLAMRHHPDKGGDTATMQEINSQYLAALNKSHLQVSFDEENKEHTYYYNPENEQQIIDFIDRLIFSHVLNAGCDAFLIGTWVWVTGDTYPVRAILKELGCTFHGKRQCWYFTPAKGRHFYSGQSLEGLAAKYGASKVANPRRDEKSLA